MSSSKAHPSWLIPWADLNVRCCLGTLSLHDQRGYGLMLGGTALGLGLGALVGPAIVMQGSGVRTVLAGSALGAAERRRDHHRPWGRQSPDQHRLRGLGLAGLAAGPLLGIATGAVLVPRLRSSSSSSSSSDSHALWIPSRKVAGFSAHLGSESGNRHQFTSAVLLASAKPSLVMNSLHKLRNLFDVATWSPMVGALPQDPGTPGSAPFLMGVSGTLR
jgi:hypothetical protein